MASLRIQILASVFCLAWWAALILSCILPMWTVAKFIGCTWGPRQIFWKGIWMICVGVEGTRPLKCEYRLTLTPSAELQAARALMVLAIITGAAGLILAFVRVKCTQFLDQKAPGAKGKVAVAAGAVLIVTGLLCLIPTSWAAIAMPQMFYNPSIDMLQQKFGACLYIGWGASILLMLGGGLFICSTCSLKAHECPSVRYLMVRSSNGTSQTGSHHRLPSVQSHPVGAGTSRA